MTLLISFELYECDIEEDKGFMLLFLVAVVIAIISICSTVARFDFVRVNLKQTLENGMEIQTREGTKEILVKASDTI